MNSAIGLIETKGLIASIAATDATFRRDQNVWDYSLQANPLNPTSTFANAPAGFNPIISS